MGPAIGNDLRYALRSFLRQRGLAAVIVITLALAIGANTAIFSVMDGLLLRALPVANPQSLLLLRWTALHSPQGITDSSSFGDCARTRVGSASAASSCSFSLPMFHTLQDQAHTFAELTAFGGSGPGSLVARNQSTDIHTQLVAGNYFTVMGLQPLLGRFLTPADDALAAPEVMVLSYRFWQQRFGGSRAVVGTTVELDQHPVTIIGVAGPSFPGLTPGRDYDAWVPLRANRLDPYWTPAQDAASSIWLVLVGRAKPGVKAAAVAAEVSGIYRNAMLHGAKPLAKDSDGLRVTVLPAQSGLNGARGQFRQPLVLLLWLVGAILLLACANIAGLLVGRAQARRREFAVRRALGAGFPRLARQLLTESMLLAVAGGVLGLGLAWLGSRALIALVLSSNPQPMVLLAPLDARVLGFALAVTILTGVLAGLGPCLALRAAQVAHGAGGSAGRGRLGSGLVVAQVALCMVVLAGAGLLVRTLQNLRAINPGFDTRNLLVFWLNPSAAGYQGGRYLEVMNRVQQGIAALPGVENVSYASSPLLAGDIWESSYIMVPKPGAKSHDVDSLAIGPGYFTAMKIPLLRGRAFRSADYHPAPPPGSKRDPNAPPQPVLVNQLFVQRFFPGADVLGRQFGYDLDGAHPRFTIIGVVGNAKYQDLKSPLDPTVYQTLTGRFANFVVRTAANPMALLPAVRSTILGIDANIPVMQPETESTTIDQLLFQERMLARLASLFAALALLLAAIGLYALLSQEVTRRTKEIGIRMALGAERRSVLRLVVVQGIALALAGLGVGLGGAVAATRYLKTNLYGVGATDPATLAAVGVLLFAIALGACWLPALRATRVQPLVALRED